MNGRSRPKAAPVTAAGQTTSFVEPPATLADALLVAEIDMRAGARLVEWAAVQRPELSRTARMAYHVASRVRGDRLIEVSRRRDLLECAA